MLRPLPLLGLVAAVVLFLWWKRPTLAAPVVAAGTAPAESGTYPRRLALPDGGELVIPRVPRRILPANAGALDLVSALVGPERVVAIPEASLRFSRLALQDGEDAQAWRALPRFRGYDAETILALGADLVITHGWQSLATGAVLAEQDVPVLVCPLPERWEDLETALTLIGHALDAETEVEELLASFDVRIARLAEDATHRPALRALSYTNLGTGGWVAGAGTTVDVLLRLAGLENAAGARRGHHQVELEDLLAMAPDVLLVGRPEQSENIGSTEAFVRGEPALASLPAVAADRIVALPQALFTTSSTELLRGAEALAAELERMAHADAELSAR